MIDQREEILKFQKQLDVWLKGTLEEVIDPQKVKEEIARKQKEEMEVLESIFSSEMKKYSDKTFEVVLQSLAMNVNFGVTMTFRMTSMYPNSPPDFEISPFGFTRTASERLWKRLLQEAQSKIGECMIFDLILLCQEIIMKINGNENLDQIEKHKLISLETFNFEDELPKEIQEILEEEEKKENTENENVSLNWRSIICEGAFQVFKTISETYDIVRVENITNHNLASQFAKRTQKKSATWVFHGTDLFNLPSIVSQGLLVPGTNGIRVENGSSFGVGIYLAKNACTSLGYVRNKSGRSYRLLVCQLIVDKDVSEYDWGYVAKNSKCVLPCYAIDLLPKSTLTTRIELSDPLIRQAYAMRHLPDGFSVATGSHFQVLEVAPHDDDDDETSYELLEYLMENYKLESEYQQYRYLDEKSFHLFEKKKSEKKSNYYS